MLALERSVHSLFSEIGTAQREAVMVVNSTVLIALAILIGAAVPSFAWEELKQTFACTAKTFNECLMEAPCLEKVRPERIPAKHQNHLPRQSRGRRNYFWRHYGRNARNEMRKEIGWV